MRPINNVSDPLTAEDFEAASILLQLSSIRDLDPVCRLTFSWTTRRKRSVRKQIEESPAVVGGSGSDACEKAEACASPDTPLLFPSIESDENLKLLKTKNSRKRKREDVLETLNHLTRNKELLSKEIENVRQYYMKQQTLNLQLKTLRQQLLIQKPPVNDRVIRGVDQYESRIWSRDHRQPLISHPTVPGAETVRSLASLSYGGAQSIAAQNAVVDNHGPSVQIKAAAIARQRRKEICRSKSKSSNTVSHKLFACSR